MKLNALQERQVVERAFVFAKSLPEFGYAEISAEIGMSEGWVSRVVRDWHDAGLVTLTKSGMMVRKMWEVRPGAQMPAPIRSPEMNMWTAMRRLKVFTPRQIAAEGSTPQTEVTVEAAQAYTRALVMAGYLKVTRKAVPGRTEAEYRLVRDTGPRPPREKRVRAIVDDNSEEVTVIGTGR